MVYLSCLEKILQQNYKPEMMGHKNKNLASMCSWIEIQLPSLFCSVYSEDLQFHIAEATEFLFLVLVMLRSAYFLCKYRRVVERENMVSV